MRHTPGDHFRLAELASVKHHAHQLEAEWEEYARREHIEVCRYKLQSEKTDRYPALDFSKSLHDFQKLFSQVFDAVRHGPKVRARVSGQIIDETTFDYGFSYPGSLGTVLTLPGESDLFGAKFDDAVGAFLRVTEIKSEADVREVISDLGEAVVSKAYNWSKSNYFGGFGADVIWRTSTGPSRAGEISRGRFGTILEIIDKTSDEEIRKFETPGMLMGIDAQTNRFRFIDPSGEYFVGPISQHFDTSVKWAINTRYRAVIEVEAVTRFATEETRQTYRLLELHTLETSDSA